MGDPLPDLVLIETLVGSAVQLRERLVQTVGDGLRLSLVDLSSHADAQDGDHRRGGSNLHIEVNRIVHATGRDELAEGTTPPCKACDGGIDADAHRDDAEHDQRNSH